MSRLPARLLTSENIAEQRVERKWIILRAIVLVEFIFVRSDRFAIISALDIYRDYYFYSDFRFYVKVSSTTVQEADGLSDSCKKEQCKGPAINRHA